MTPVTKRLVLAESAAAKLDLTGDLGGRSLDHVASVVEDRDGALDDDGTRRFEGDGYGRGLLGGIHRPDRGRQGTVPAKRPLAQAVLNPGASSSSAWKAVTGARKAAAMPRAVTRGCATRCPREEPPR